MSVWGDAANSRRGSASDPQLTLQRAKKSPIKEMMLFTLNLMLDISEYGYGTLKLL